MSVSTGALRRRSVVRRSSRLVAASALCLALALSACSKSEDTGSSSSGGSAGKQVVASGSADSGKGCTLEKSGATKIDLKDATVGFSQSEKEANPFRIAETQSIKDEAGKLGVKKLLTTNAQSDLSKQIADINDMINNGAQALIVAPLNSDGLEPALSAARAKKIPVITIDRKINATACTDYLTFIGSNFVQQGKIAAQQMAKALDNKGKVAILLGSSGNNVTTDRTSGFVDEMKASSPDIEIVAQQTGEFARDKGQQVMEQLIQSNPEITGVYAENDEMALGALTALSSAGKKPGTDVQVVSIDGTKNAVEKVVSGDIFAVVESNPRFGPLAFSTLQDFFGGKGIPENVIISDKLYTKDNAAKEVDGAY